MYFRIKVLWYKILPYKMNISLINSGTLDASHCLICIRNTCTKQESEKYKKLMLKYLNTSFLKSHWWMQTNYKILQMSELINTIRARTHK